MQKIRKLFVSPDAMLRGAPFWSWNDRLDQQELDRQVKDMHDHGMGGFFMHSRDGLETVYMSDEWMSCIKETVKTAKEIGNLAWLYDEDRWPSGAAGGLVPAAGGDDYRIKALTVELAETAPDDDEHILAVFAAQIDGDTLVLAEPTSKGQAADGEVLLIFRRELSEPSEWFNDDTYADNLNPDSVRAFIDTTYEAYAELVGDEFGKTIPGIFTDEPNVKAVNLASQRRCLPWTDSLPAFFAERRGYDLLSVLPLLFFDGEGQERARHDYWHTIADRFSEAYAKQLGEWCDAHGLAFTGHFLNENELGTGIKSSGAMMPHYRYQAVPGIDMLTEQTYENLTIKQCSSAANQMGRKHVLSETYGCSSWEFDFEGQKWVGDWQYVLGVNIRCQHLALYSLRGCRKRDYPPAFNYNTTWWKYNALIEDYFARIAAVTTSGKAVRDVLVLHPVSTGWTMLKEGSESEATVNEYGQHVNDFTRAVLATHHDFDFGDEIIMADLASVQDGKIKVGEVSYQAVVIPPLTRTMFKSTLKTLVEYSRNGGTVIAFKTLPAMVEGVESEDLEKLWNAAGTVILNDVSELKPALDKAVPQRVSIRTRQGMEDASILYMQRKIGDANAYFVVNNDRNNTHELIIELEGAGRVEEWDPLTGETREIAVERKGNLVSFASSFGPTDSRIYVIDPEQEPALQAEPLSPMPAWYFHAQNPSWYIGPECAFSRTDPNILTLDMCRYAMSEDEWSDEMEVWRAQDDVRQALGMRSNYYNGLPQRYKWACQAHPKDGTPVAFAFVFEVDTPPSSPVYLLVEGAGDYEISLNGEPVDNKIAGWYLDRAMHKVRLPSLICGTNVLVLSCGYTNHMEVEDCFILGDFGVSMDRHIIAEPETLHFGDWTSQGYPHYAGSMIYHAAFSAKKEDKTYRLYLGEWKAIDIALYVNGNLVGHIPWAARNGFDLTPYLVPGANNVDIEVVSSPRNMLGPLHLAAGREPWTDWRSFRRTNETYTPNYVLKAWGLFGQVTICEE